MTASRRRFTQEFKDELCREVINTSKPIKDVATAYASAPRLSAADQLEGHLAGMDFQHFTSTTIVDELAFRRELEVTRERGYAVDDEEHEPGICCIAVPVFAASGLVTGSVSVSAPSSRMPLGQLLEFLPEIRRTGEEVSESLGYRKHANLR